MSSPLNEEQAKELSALVDWLGTFGVFQFDFRVVMNDPGKLVEELSSSEVTRAISKIAEEVCESPVDSSHTSASSPGQGGGERIWTALLMLTSTRARPLPKDVEESAKMNPARLKLYVLSNLLDCAVQSPNMHRRRKYIERIMKLDKQVQKMLMGLIEKRSGSSNKKVKRSPIKEGRNRSPFPSRASLQQKRSLFESPSTASDVDSVASPPPTSAQRQQQSAKRSTFNAKLNLLNSIDTVNTSTPVKQTPQPPTTKNTRNRQLLNPNESPSPQALTPERNTNSRGGVASDLLSPGTLESPNKVHGIVQDLRGRATKFETILESYKTRETELVKKIEELEASHRNEMLKLESMSMDREQELTQQYDERIQELKIQLADAQEKARKGDEALKELEKCREELEILQQGQSNLAELNEKLRKYKQKADELQDIKEALEREQEAHGRSVDEIVRLENELQALVPLKRQLEEYKIRAIEAEVKLVECHDYLHRIEAEASENTAVNESLRKGALTQQQQMEELRQRIQLDTQMAALGQVGNGIGQGLSELNPELKEELLRLRNENIQLRAFAEKRSNDAVQKMAESLDDLRRLADRYKNEYLTTKEKLEELKHTLQETREREAKLILEVGEWKEQTERSRAAAKSMEDHLEQVKTQWEHTKLLLDAAENRNATLRSDVNAWMNKFNEAEKTNSWQTNEIQALKKEVEKTRASLKASEQTVGNLRNQLLTCEEKLDRMTRSGKELEAQLETNVTKLADNQKEIEVFLQRVTVLQNKVDKLQNERANLEKQVEQERHAKQEAMDEAHQSLEATREVLQAKAKKDIEELQLNMNQLLEDERKNNRQKQDEFHARLHATEQRWKEDYQELQERSALSLKHSREEAQERIETIRDECNKEIAKARSQADEARHTIISKGKAMLEEAKAKAAEELGRIYNEKVEVEDKLDLALRENEEMEKLFRAKVTSLKNKLDCSIQEIGKLTTESEQLNEQVKALEREKNQLQEDNDRCRRQLRGRYGSGDKTQAQLEKLQSEYNAILEENRELKRNVRNNGVAGSLGVLSEPDMSDLSTYSGQYAHGGAMNKDALTHLRQDYENMVERLNDEKREMIMKYSSACTNMEKAEQRAWKAEQEINSLRDQITSLKLQVERNELGYNHKNSAENRFTNDSAFGNSCGEEETKSPTRASRSHSFLSGPHRRSPGIDRAMKEKAELENTFRSMLLTVTKASPPGLSPENDFARQTPDSNVLSQTRRYDQQLNRSSLADGAVLSSARKTESNGIGMDARVSALMEYTKLQDDANDGENTRPGECQQS